MAIVAPAVSLVGLTVRVNRQERELHQTRVTEQRRQSAGEIRRVLLARLAELKQAEVAAIRLPAGVQTRTSRAETSVVLVGTIDDDRLVLPFDGSSSAKRFTALVSGGPFGRAIQRGERAEFIANQLDSAASAYREAIRLGHEDVQTGYARLLLARVLARSGKRGDAAATYAAIFGLGFTVTDEQGMPLALYAAGPLLEAGTSPSGVLQRLRVEVESSRGIAPAALFLVRDLTRRSGQATAGTPNGDWEPVLSERIARAELSLALQAQFPRLPLASPANRSAIPAPSGCHLATTHGWSAWSRPRRPLPLSSWPWMRSDSRQYCPTVPPIP